MFLKKFITENKIVYFFFYLAFFSHFYLWDLSNINNTFENSSNIPFWILRYLVLFFLLNFFFNKKALDKNFLIIFIIIIFQIILNLILYDQIINLKEFGSIIFFFLLYLVTFYEKDRILRTLKSFFELVIVINFLGLIYFYINDEIRIVFEYKFQADACAFIVVDNLIFHENSHYAIMNVPILVYYIFEKINLRNSIFIFMLIINFIIYLSLTFVVGIIISLLLCFLISIIHDFNKKYILFLLLCFFITILVIQKNCSARIEYLIKKTNYDMNFIVKNKSNDHEYKKLTADRNLSSEVYNIAILNTINTFKEGRIFGWGFNSYFRAYEDNEKNIINKYYLSEYTEDPEYQLFTLNKYDARSTLLKMLNEFGLLSLIFLYFAYKFLLNKSINLKYKASISSLLITQLISGVGYFNGGFAIFLFLMIILHDDKKKYE
tara:strand:+ start:11271 stop:12575 length:1305 start_codon:yes stop_codon:yes gene_type:complete